MNNTKEDIDCFDKILNYWDEQKFKYASKLSIILSILGAVGSVLIGLNMFVPASVVMGVCNLGIFAQGLIAEKLKNHNEKIIDENKSLQNEKNEMVRRFTQIQYQFPTSEAVPSQILGNDTPKSNASTETEPFANVIDLRTSHTVVFPDN